MRSSRTSVLLVASLLIALSGSGPSTAQEPPPDDPSIPVDPIATPLEDSIESAMLQTATEVARRLSVNPGEPPPRVATSVPRSLVLFRLRAGEKPKMERVLTNRRRSVAGVRAKRLRSGSRPDFVAVLTDATGKTALHWTTLPELPRLRVESAPGADDTGRRPVFRKLREVVVPVEIPFEAGSLLTVVSLDGQWAGPAVVAFGDEPETFRFVDRPTP